MKLIWLVIYTWLFLIATVSAGAVLFGIVAGVVTGLWWVSVLAFFVGVPLDVYVWRIAVAAVDKSLDY